MKHFGIIVAGGGPAGVSAAVAAARAGRRVLLLERQGCLGGVWTAGLLSYVFDFDKSDIGWEIIRRLDALGARRPDRTDAYDTDRDWVYEPEYMKFVCEEMCREAGVKVLLGSPVVAAERAASTASTPSPGMTSNVARRAPTPSRPRASASTSTAWT